MGWSPNPSCDAWGKKALRAVMQLKGGRVRTQPPRSSQGPPPPLSSSPTPTELPSSVSPGPSAAPTARPTTSLTLCHPHAQTGRQPPPPTPSCAISRKAPPRPGSFCLLPPLGLPWALHGTPLPSSPVCLLIASDQSNSLLSRFPHLGPGASVLPRNEGAPALTRYLACPLF